MKRIILFAFIGAFFLATANAQFSFGAKGGLTVSSMNMDVLPDTAIDPIFGYHAGIFFKCGDGLFSFQPEVTFVRRGMMVNDKESDWYHQYNMNYIDVPLLLRIGVNLKIAELYFNLGPYASYLLSAKVKTQTFDEGLGSWVTNDYDYEFDGYVDKRYDGGVVMGVGVRVLMMVFEVRYNTGLIHVSDSDRFNSSNNKYLNVSLGVQL